jgi:hypothetical protein
MFYLDSIVTMTNQNYIQLVSDQFSSRPTPIGKMKEIGLSSRLSRSMSCSSVSNMFIAFALFSSAIRRLISSNSANYCLFSSLFYTGTYDGAKSCGSRSGSESTL